jgi:hypothetical protein
VFQDNSRSVNEFSRSGAIIDFQIGQSGPLVLTPSARVASPNNRMVEIFDSPSMRATPSGYDQKPVVGKPITINAIATVNGDANSLRKSKSTAADASHGRRSKSHVTDNWNETSHQSMLHRSETQIDVDRGLYRKYRPAADVNYNRTDDYRRRHSGTLPGHGDRNKRHGRAHVRGKDKTGYLTDEGYVYNDEQTVLRQSGYQTDEGFYGEMETDASHSRQRAPVERRQVRAVPNKVSFTDNNNDVAARRLLQEPIDTVDMAPEVSAAASKDFVGGGGFERLQMRRTSAVEDDEVEIPVIIRNKPDVHQQIINNRRSMPARQDQQMPATVRSNGGTFQQKTDYSQTAMAEQKLATPSVIRNELSVPQPNNYSGQVLSAAPVARRETEVPQQRVDSRQVTSAERQSTTSVVARDENRAPRQNLNSNQVVSTEQNLAIVRNDGEIHRREAHSRQATPATQNAVAKMESEIPRLYVDDRKAMLTELANQTSGTPAKVDANPVTLRTPMRSSQKNTSDEKFDLVAIRNSLRPVERRGSADNMLNADDSSLIENVIKQTMEEFDAESTNMLAELGRARNMLAAEQMSDSQLHEFLRQLNARASIQEGGANESPTEDRSGTMTENRGQAPDVSMPTMSSRMSEASTTNTLMSDNQNKRLVSGASGRTTDENNNKDDTRRMMSPDQLERIESWRTAACWNDNSTRDSLEELDEYLNKQQAGDDPQSDVTSILSRHSSRARSSSSSSCDEYGGQQDDDVDGKQSVQFEYFFGFDTPVIGKR